VTKLCDFFIGLICNSISWAALLTSHPNVVILTRYRTDYRVVRWPETMTDLSLSLISYLWLL